MASFASTIYWIRCLFFNVWFLTPLSKLSVWVYFWDVCFVPLVCFYGHITFSTYNYASISRSHENAALGQLNSGLPAEWVRGECQFIAVNYLKIIFNPDMPQIRMTVPLSRAHTSISVFSWGAPFCCSSDTPVPLTPHPPSLLYQAHHSPLLLNHKKPSPHSEARSTQPFIDTPHTHT